MVGFSAKYSQSAFPWASSPSCMTNIFHREGKVSVDVRMIINEAVLNNATVLAFVHNHPSGNIHPSKFDDTLTQTLKKACDLMRIHFLDHVIVCDGDYYSYHDRGRL